MPNSTFFQATNTCLRRHGQKEIVDASTFNTQGSLTKTQSQCKHFIMEANAWLALDVRPEFLRRRGTITTTSSSNDNTTGYTLACTPSSLIPHTWFNTTSGKGEPLTEKKFTDWVAEDPDGHTATGRPKHWIVIPQSALGATDRVSFQPIPDAAYTIRYEYWHEPAMLSVASDEIVWTPRIEPILWESAGAFLEVILAEGKAAEMSQFLIPHLTKIRQITGASDELPPHVIMGMNIGYRSRGRRSAFSPD